MEKRSAFERRLPIGLVGYLAATVKAELKRPKDCAIEMGSLQMQKYQCVGVCACYRPSVCTAVADVTVGGC